MTDDKRERPSNAGPPRHLSLACRPPSVSIPQADLIDEIGKFYFGFLADNPLTKPIGIVVGPTEFIQIQDEIRRKYNTLHEWLFTPQLFQLPLHIAVHCPGVTLLIDPSHAMRFARVVVEPLPAK